MYINVLIGALLPLVGTTAGSLIAFAPFKKLSRGISALLSGFASGVMLAASVWSLILPAIEYSSLGRFCFIEICIGISSGMIMMLISEKYISEKRLNTSKEGLLYFAVTLHNLPEGMAIGAAYSAFVCSGDENLAVKALLLSVGIAVQNIPEGAIVSVPLENMKSSKAFINGVMSGIVEPLAVILTVLLSEFLVPLLPLMLSFAAGTMIFVVLKELVPDFSDAKEYKRGITAFFTGFMIMMSLDVALG